MPRLAVLSLVALAACASSGPTPGSGSSGQTISIGAGGAGGTARLNTSVSAAVSSVPFPLDDVWRFLPAAFDSLGIPKALIDPATHTLGNQGMKVRQRLGKTPLSRFIDCGSTQIGPSADTYEVFLTVATQLQSAGTGTTISTTVEAVAKPLNFNQEYSRCSSRGVLESRIVDAIRKEMTP